MATYSFTVAVANADYWNVLRATIEAIGEEIANLFGYRMTRLRASHAAGATTLNVESTYGFATSGTLLLQNELDPVTYGGIVQTPTGQQFTGCSALEFAHAEEEEVIDWNRNTSKMDELRRALLIAYASGADLNRIGRSNVVPRPRPMSADADYRRLVETMAWMQKNNIYALELLLDALFPPAGGCASARTFEIYESLVEHPNQVFITLPDELGTTEKGRAFMTRRDDKTSATATTVTIDKIPVTVISVRTQPVSQTLAMGVLPSADTPAWTYQAESAGAEGTYFSVAGGILTHDHPAGTDSGRYYRTIVEIDQLYNRLECAFKINSTTTVGGYPWKLYIQDGEREYALIWTDAAVALGQEDETVVAGPVAFTFGTDWHRLKIERDGLWIYGYVDGTRVLSALASAFGASAGTIFSFGYTDNGNANQWNVSYDDVRIYSKSTENYWNLPGTNGQLSAGSDILQDAGNPFVAGDTGKVIFVDATNDVNYGTWLGTHVAAGQLQLDGIPHADGVCDTLQPTSFVTRRDRFTSRDVGKTFTVTGGANAGDHIITAVTNARLAVCAASTFVTQTSVPWKFKPTFVNEGPGIDYVLTNAGSNVAAALTLRQSLPQVNQPVTVHYTDVKSAQVLQDETVVNTNGTAYYPFYLSGPDEWIRTLLEDVTAAGVIPKFRNPF
jgi:hypothetical protein